MLHPQPPGPRLRAGGVAGELGQVEQGQQRPLAAERESAEIRQTLGTNTGCPFSYKDLPIIRDFRKSGKK